MQAPAIATKVRLGDVLVERKIISREQLRVALDDQKRSGRRLGRVLVENAFCNSEQIAEALARQLAIPYVNLKFYNLSNDVVRRLPELQARRFRALVLEERVLQLARAVFLAEVETKRMLVEAGATAGPAADTEAAVLLETSLHGIGRVEQFD